MEAKIPSGVIQTTSASETRAVAKELAQSLKRGDVLALFGNLGAGKTVFVQGLAEGLNVETPITSPTFVFTKTYTAKVSGKKITFYHLDLYRIENNNQLQTLGMDEIFEGNSIVAVEWAEKLGKLLPKRRINITIDSKHEKTRSITIDRRV